jgi:hypothetical protein
MALWTPAAIATDLWLDAADSATLFDAVSGGSLVAADGAVARWEDKSGNGRHATQATLGSRPLRKTSIQNGIDVLRFDGGDFMAISDLSLFKNIGFAVVATVAKVANVSQFIFGAETNAGSTRIGLSTSVNGLASQRAILARRLDADSVTFAQSSLATNDSYRVQIGVFRFSEGTIENRDGADIKTSSLPSSGNTSNTDSTSIRIGSIAGGFFANGDIPELLVFTSAITADEILIVEGYLHWRWGLQGNLPANHPYKNAAPAIGGGIIPILRQHYAAQGAR